MANDKKKIKQIEKSYKAEIEQTEKVIEKEKKEYHKAVKALLKADKELAPINKRVMKKPSDKNLEKQAEAKKALSDAALEYKAIGDSIETRISELEQRSDYLSRFYFQNGDSKAANNEKGRFERYYEKHVAELCKASKNSDEVVSSAFDATGAEKEVADELSTDSIPVPAPVTIAVLLMFSIVTSYSGQPSPYKIPQRAYQNTHRYHRRAYGNSRTQLYRAF